MREFHKRTTLLAPSTQVVALERFAVIDLELLGGAFSIIASLPFMGDRLFGLIISRPVLGIAFTAPMISFHLVDQFLRLFDVGF